MINAIVGALVEPLEKVKKTMSKNKTIKQMEQAYKSAGRNILARYREFLNCPRDIETLHQFRISLRVARSLVKFAKPYLNKKQEREMSSLLKELQAPTSRMRELDMLVKQLTELEEAQAACAVTGWRSATNAGVLAAQSKPAGSADVLKQCKSAQKKTRRKLVKTLRKKSTRKEVKRVAKLLANLQWRNRFRKNGIAAYKLIERVSAERIACEERVAAVDPYDLEQVHDVRKRAKGLRYVTRELAALLPEDSARTSSDMKAVQDKLGDMLDARTNARLLEEICGDAANEQAGEFVQRAEDIANELSK